MSQSAFFLTGANAKIVLNGNTFAFVTDISYTVDIRHVAPKILGMYESSTVEAVSYNVSGTFTLIRYFKDVSVDNPPDGVNPNGNGLGNWGKGVSPNGEPSNYGSFGGVTGRPEDNLNPSTYNQGTFFDIEIFQKSAKRADAKSDFEKANQFLSSLSTNVRSKVSGGTSTKNVLYGTNLPIVARVRDCRIVRADFFLSKKAPAQQRFNFIALYADEDSFTANFSGVGQQWV
jgi:hypothetical protein